MPQYYKLAEECFKENLLRIGEPSSQPDAFNLNQGLLGLSNSIERDFGEVKALLSQVLLELRKRR